MCRLTFCPENIRNSILETVRLEAEMKVIEDFIGELLAHRDYLAANSPGADADADVGDDA